jgi:hypothetical protein
MCTLFDRNLYCNKKNETSVLLGYDIALAGNRFQKFRDNVVASCLQGRMSKKIFRPLTVKTLRRVKMVRNPVTRRHVIEEMYTAAIPLRKPNNSQRKIRYSHTNNASNTNRQHFHYILNVSGATKCNRILICLRTLQCTNLRTCQTLR